MAPMNFSLQGRPTMNKSSQAWDRPRADVGVLKLVAAVAGLACLLASSNASYAQDRTGYEEPPVTLSGTFWAGGLSSYGLKSSSGYYNGSTAGNVVEGGGLSFNYKMGSFFGDHAVRYGLGASVDIFHGSETFNGTGGFGAFPVAGSAETYNLDILASFRVMTHIAPRVTAAISIKPGFEEIIPNGSPLGGTGTAFNGSAWAPTARVAGEIDFIQTGGYKIGLTAAVQWTAPTKYTTSLPGEYFKAGAQTKYVVGLLFEKDFGDGPGSREAARRQALPSAR